VFSLYSVVPVFFLCVSVFTCTSVARRMIVIIPWMFSDSSCDDDDVFLSPVSDPESHAVDRENFSFKSCASDIDTGSVSF